MRRVDRVVAALLAAAALALAGGDELDRALIPMPDLIDAPAEVQAAHREIFRRLDPDRAGVPARLDRLDRGDPAAFAALVGRLGAADYHARSEAAAEILIFRIQDVKALLDQYPVPADPEVRFQFEALQSELETHPDRHRERAIGIRDNLLWCLADAGDPRYFEYAGRMYAGADTATQDRLLRLAGAYPAARRTAFMVSVIDQTREPLLSRVFREIRGSAESATVRAAARGVLADPARPVMLRAAVAVLYPAAGRGLDQAAIPSDPSAGFIAGLLAGIIRPNAPAADAGTRPSAGGPEQVRWNDGSETALHIGHLDCAGDIRGHTDGGPGTWELARVAEVRLVPTARRENADLACRVILRDRDMVSGTIRSIDAAGIALTASYLAAPVTIPAADAALIQFGVERRAPAPPAVNTADRPVVRLRDGSQLRGAVTTTGDRRFTVILTGVTLGPAGGGRLAPGVSVAAADIDAIEFPGPAVVPAAGSCRVRTMYGDILTGHLIDMDADALRLFVPRFGVVTVARGALERLAFDAAGGTAAGVVLAAFRGEGRVALFDGQGRLQREWPGLAEPAYAERTPGGDLLVCEYGAGRVAVYTMDDRRPVTVIAGLRAPFRAHAGADGSVLVICRQEGNGIRRFDAAGNLRATWSTLPNPVDAAPLGDGRLAAINGTEAATLTADDRIASATEFEGEGDAGAVQVTPEGTVLVSAKGAVIEYDTAWRELRRRSDFNKPQAWRTGRTYLVQDGDRVYRLDADLKTTGEWALPSAPDGVSFY
ncbi:MAG: hypothetical protein ABIF71_10080 [Planctomycetota bacterium]